MSPFAPIELIAFFLSMASLHQKGLLPSPPRTQVSGCVFYGKHGTPHLHLLYHLTRAVKRKRRKVVCLVGALF